VDHPPQSERTARGQGIELTGSSGIGEIDAAFASLAHDRPDALFVAADAFFASLRAQIASFSWAGWCARSSG
jgi:hypothetical protein